MSFKTKCDKVLDELKPIVKYLNTKNIVAEIFVHGAYCISFSGQCYFSNYLYGEAGNRGLCVQPCRREFISNNKNFTPFNLKDNCAINFVKELKDSFTTYKLIICTTSGNVGTVVYKMKDFESGKGARSLRRSFRHGWRGH